MIWWSQIVVIGCLAASFALLVTSYRKKESQQNVYLLSFLLSIAALFVPDTWIFIPCTWWALSALRAENFRSVVASFLGVTTILIYTALAIWLWPNSAAMQFILHVYEDCLCRQFGWWNGPGWQTITTGISMLLGIAYQIAHISRYPSANVRVQIRFLIAAPVYWISFISCLFPTCTGNCLLWINWLSSFYLVYLFLHNYGLPPLRSFLPKRSVNSRTRSFSRRESHSTKRKTLFHRNTSPQRRSFSRNSRRR